MLFLAGAGVAAGHGFVETVARYGWLLFGRRSHRNSHSYVYRVCLGYVCALSSALPDTLGSICGGMTATPALGALITAAGQ